MQLIHSRPWEEGREGGIKEYQLCSINSQTEGGRREEGEGKSQSGMSHRGGWEETGVKEREGGKEGDIIMVGGCQGEREEREAEGGKERRARERVQPTPLKPFNW